MRTSLVMTVIAEDRPSLVDAISGVIAEHNGNWLESRMSRLGGQFAGIIRVEVPAEKQEQLVESLRALDASGLKVSVHLDAPLARRGDDFRILEVVGHDRPGIVHQISRALARNGVNVEELSSEVASAAMSGEPLFKARAKVLLPEGCDPERLQQELEKVAADLIVELSFARAVQGP
jgi:glycine cleavage system regulatory protein